MNLLNLLIVVIVLGLIFAVVWWGINQIALPPPFKTVAVGLFVLIVVVVLVGVLTGTVNFPILRVT